MYLSIQNAVTGVHVGDIMNVGPVKKNLPKTDLSMDYWCNLQRETRQGSIITNDSFIVITNNVIHLIKFPFNLNSKLVK